MKKGKGPKKYVGHITTAGAAWETDEFNKMTYSRGMVMWDCIKPADCKGSLNAIRLH
jgi:hypothetical protein